jgi:hypothetical protein
MKSKCPLWRGKAPVRTRRQARGLGVLWLMRLSYFRYALKTAADPRKLFAEANQELQLTDRFKTLLEQFIPSTKIEDLVEPLTAMLRLAARRGR